MSEKDYNKQLAERLLKYLEINGKTQTDLANYLGTNKSTVSSWCSGSRAPRIETLDRICTYFNIRRSDLMGTGTSEDKEHYYIDVETMEYADELKNNKDLRLMFDAARDVKKEDLQIVYNMLLALKQKEQGDN